MLLCYSTINVWNLYCFYCCCHWGWCTLVVNLVAVLDVAVLDYIIKFFHVYHFKKINISLGIFPLRFKTFFTRAFWPLKKKTAGGDKGGINIVLSPLGRSIQRTSTKFSYNLLFYLQNTHTLIWILFPFQFIRKCPKLQ